ncbi:MAG: hypothetical protein KDC56_02225 [Flavobacteriaceae bacterium]|nr:hypothetical protein [Flavobacteriaceae bacterium]
MSLIIRTIISVILASFDSVCSSCGSIPERRAVDFKKVGITGTCSAFYRSD